MYFPALESKAEAHLRIRCASVDSGPAHSISPFQVIKVGVDALYDKRFHLLMADINGRNSAWIQSDV